MSDFSITIGGTEYKVRSNHQSKEHKNYSVDLTITGIRVNITIPIEAQKTRVEIMQFIDSFNTALTKAIKDNNLDQRY
jgi:hypothetical protein